MALNRKPKLLAPAGNLDKLRYALAYGADLQYAYFDENEDEYDDVSYDAGATSGDLNLDGTDNIQDIITLVNNILNP